MEMVAVVVAVVVEMPAAFLLLPFWFPSFRWIRCEDVYDANGGASSRRKVRYGRKKR